MSQRVENINIGVLRQCREQMGFPLADIENKVKSIADIEEGQKKPTYRQLDILADFYKVPRWVFISDELPEKYQLTKSVPAFRQFSESNTDVFSIPKVRSLIAQVERFRELIIELRNDFYDPIDTFRRPISDISASPEHVAAQVRKWLSAEGNFKFSEWKEKLEKQNIFVFMTSKYKSWSHVGKSLFRGLAVYHPILPVIIINDSDAKKAQSFTLFHELGHLLRKESFIDGGDNQDKAVERWCDQLAGNVLMPTDAFREVVGDINGFDDLKRIAGFFKVSPYACLVRLEQLEIIDQPVYLSFEKELKKQYKQQQKKLKENKGGPSRQRPAEVLNQYGRIYTNAIFQAYYNKEIGLHKLCTLFDIKQASHALKLETKL